MKWALVRDGVIENIIVYDGAEYTPPEGTVLMSIADNLDIGDAC